VCKRKQKGHLILFPGPTFNEPPAPASPREQSLLRRNTRAWEWVCALFCLIAMAGCAGLVSQSLPAPSGTGQLSVSPGSVDFGNVEVGTASTQTVTFSNAGSGSLTISQAAVSGAGFTMAGQTYPLTLSAGQSSSINVQFAPTDTSSTIGSVSLLSSATTLTTSVTLKGTGVKHQLSITPSSVSFGNVAVGTASAQTVTLTNSGTASLSISQGSVTGAGFGMSGLTFPLSLAPGQSSTFNAQFAPTAPGSASGSVSISSNARNSPAVVSLAGSGMLAALSPNPSTFNFGNVLVGSSGTQTITLSNSGTASVTISAASASGAGFSIAGLSVPATLNAGQAASFTASFAPASAASFTGSVSITSDAPGSPLTIPLSGTGTAAQPQLTINPATVNFGSVNVGATAIQMVSLTNSGSAALTISQATGSGTGFSLSGLSLPQTINVGSSISFTAQFLPASTGSASGNIAISSNAPGSPAAVALSGTGVQGTLTANPSSFNFGNVLVGGNGTQTFTLSNSGTASVTISAASVLGTGFSITGLSVPLTLAAGQNTTFSAQFTPSATGSASGSVSITSNAPGSPLTIALSGTGVQPTLSVTPTSVSFGSVVTGNNTSQTIILKNSGTASLTISQATVSGTGFTITGLTVPATIAAGGSTTFSAAFAPTTAGSATGSVSLVSNAPGSPFAIALSGTGVAATLLLGANPTSLSLGNVNVGGNGSSSVTLTNTGNSNVNISSVTVSGAGFSASGVTSSTTLTPNQTVTLSVAFAPASAGSVTGSVSVASNATNSPVMIALSGTGVQGALIANPSSFNFGNVLVGGNGTQTFTLSNSGTASVTISAASASGTGFSITGLSVPLTLAAGQSTTFGGQFAPSATGSASGSVSITSNAPGSPLPIALSGTGVQPQLAAIPSSASFGSVVTGTSNSQTIKLSNGGTASVTISQATVSGSGFSLTGITVPLTIAAGSSATFNVGFTPSAAGSVTGAVSLVSNAPNSPLAIALSGTGVTATFLLTANPTSLSFGSVNLGSNSLLSASLTNTGNSNVTISSLTISGAGFSASGVTSGTTLTPNQAVTLSVTFAPASAGSLTGSVSVVSNATNSPATIALSGTGVQLIAHSAALSWTASTSVVTGYNIYRGTVSGGPYAKLNSSLIALTTYTDSTVQSGQTYFYIVTAVDASNVESAYSNEISAIIPFP